MAKGGSVDAVEAAAKLERLSDAARSVEDQLARAIVGQEEVVEQLLVALFSHAHALLVGVPGLAKTLMVSSLARALDLSFRRIQFTPDLMPADITGTDVIQPDPETGQRTMQFLRGPVFANLILADEVNRTPPKTQAALLESMQEHQVSIGDTTYPLPDPFFVLATQNPIEQEGTYPLPEAQLDRFMLEIRIGYPKRDEEERIVARTTGRDEPEISPVLNAEEIIELQGLIREIPAAPHVVSYAVNLARASRPEDPTAPEFIKRWVAWGAGVRAGQYLILGAKARAALRGRPAASVDDVRDLAHAVMRHRVLINFNAEAEGVHSDEIISRLLEVIGNE
ncbi:MAG TPA: AAA family ATPase [bacterium]|nr:AAA family ATPase [bacterium]